MYSRVAGFCRAGNIPMIRTDVRHNISFCLLVAAGILCFYTAAQPRIFSLNAPYDVWDTITADLNQDGIADILALTCDGSEQPYSKALCGYFSNGTGFPEQPTFAEMLPPSASIAFLVEADGVPPKEILVADALTETLYRVVSDHLEKETVRSVPTLLPYAAKEPIFLRDTVKDIDGDNKEEWFLPVPGGYEIRNAEGLRTFIECDVVSEVRRKEGIYVYWRLPALMFFRNESTAGLAFASDEYLDIAYGEGWNQRKRFKIPLLMPDKWDAQVKMDDLNADGLPDVIVTQTRGTVNLEVGTQVFLLRPDLTLSEQPDAKFTTKSAVSSPVVVDLDGDGKKDLLYIRIPFNVTNIVNFFLRGKVSVDLAAYCYGETGYTENPTFSTSLTMDTPDGPERVAYALGDFNGDGRKDIAFTKNANTMVVHVGEKTRLLSAKPWQTLSVPAYGAARSEKITPDSREDLLVFHPGMPNSKRIEVITF